MSRTCLHLPVFLVTALLVAAPFCVACAAADSAELNPSGNACRDRCGDAGADAARGENPPAPTARPRPDGFERRDPPPSVADAGRDADLDGSPEADAGCEPTLRCETGELEALAPRVLLLVDRSGSMTYPFAGVVTRWEALSQVLTDPASGVIAQFRGDVEFALAFYTYRGAASASCEVLSEVFLGDYQQAFSDHPPILDGQTPTAEALAQAAGLLGVHLSGSQGPSASRPSPSAIILATDGMPDSCTDQKVDTDGSPAAQRAVAAEVVARTRELYAAGIRTYVVGVGAQLQRAHLQDLANAGAGHDASSGSGQPGVVYQAGDSVALRAAFDDHVSTLRSCSFSLDRPLDDIGSAEVTLDGRVLTPAEDWQLQGQAQVTLVGEACEQLKSTGGHVRAVVPCGCE
ncbi:MAG: VWA domain-containing protein [Myxococcales bacterium]|nr:VWA domain-containing protein [Myxococcales bacterium]